MIRNKLEELYKQAERYYTAILVNATHETIRLSFGGTVIKLGENGDLVISSYLTDFEVVKILLIDSIHEANFISKRNELLREMLDYLGENEKRLKKEKSWILGLRRNSIYDLSVFLKDQTRPIRNLSSAYNYYKFLIHD